MIPTRPFLCAGERVGGVDVRQIHNPYRGATVAFVAHAGAAHVARALDAASACEADLAARPAHAQVEVLETAMAHLAARCDEVCDAIVCEAGKPITAARAEVDRCFDTFRDAIYAAQHPAGALEALDATRAGQGRTGLTLRVPVGLVTAFTPFNFPLNLVAHKLLPAVVARCPIVLKPAPQTPSAALLLAECFWDAGWPAPAMSVLPADVEAAQALVSDPRIRLFSFTGSAQVGWKLKQQTTRARVMLELGGNAACYVAADADLDLAASRIAAGSMSYAGQSCISTQRVVVHADVAAAFRTRLQAQIEAIVSGDPADPATVVGPVLRDRDADRIEAWIAQALAEGAKLVTGGERQGRLIAPTLLDHVPAHTQVWQEEVFGPVVALREVGSDTEALTLMDESRYGLQAAIFTSRIDLLMLAARSLHVGGLIHNDTSAFRVDSMPYGGVRDSGLGREGPRHAIADYTEPRIVVLRA